VLFVHAVLREKKEKYAGKKVVLHNYDIIHGEIDPYCEGRVTLKIRPRELERFLQLMFAR
jgi:hypothetical protein